ncbi:histidine phosphatase family protein [Viridibacterium curvum]|uniref:Histidine phosphatase family protein n=1 Tax=Viridibacterium curvum TaxID=1101404 RepID=A0ABP9QGX0_9RHOO
MRQITIVRHGQTASNAAKLLQGRRDIALSELGSLQANALAEALRDNIFDQVISSPLQRALCTANAIARNRIVSVEIDQRLQERSFGLFEDQLVQVYQDALAASGELRWVYRPPGGETIGDVWQRCANFLADLHARPFRSVLIAAHEGINRALALQLLHRPVSEWTSFKQENCCINRFHFDEDGHLKEYSLNDTGHLATLR